MSKNPKNWWKSMKIGNIARENLQNFWTTWVISMTFSGKMCLMAILKVTKTGFHPLFRRYIFRKTTGGVRGVKLTLRSHSSFNKLDSVSISHQLMEYLHRYKWSTPSTLWRTDICWWFYYHFERRISLREYLLTILWFFLLRV